MNFKVEYITDTRGKRKSVVISEKDWNRVNDFYSKKIKKLETLLDLKKSIHEVELYKKGKKKLKTLTEVLFFEN